MQRVTYWRNIASNAAADTAVMIIAGTGIVQRRYKGAKNGLLAYADELECGFDDCRLCVRWGVHDRKLQRPGRQLLSGGNLPEVQYKSYIGLVRCITGRKYTKRFSRSAVA